MYNSNYLKKILCKSLFKTKLFLSHYPVIKKTPNLVLFFNLQKCNTLYDLFYL